MVNFYVYSYLDPRKPGNYRYGPFVFFHEPFYIGKGKSKRDTQSRNYYGNNHFKGKMQKIREPIIHRLIEGVTEEKAINLEKLLIKLCGRNDLGKGPLVNLTDGGDGITGYLFPDEVKEKMKKSRANRRTEFSREAIEKSAYARRGKPLSGEHRKKISESCMENPPTKGMKGRKHSEATKKKQSLAQKGKILSAEHRKKLLGIKRSRQARKNISIAVKKVWAQRKGSRQWVYA